MKAFLMFPDRDFERRSPLVPNAQTLVEDLGLQTMLETMAAGDQRVFDAAKSALLTGTLNCDQILYRQTILRDCLRNPTVVRELYDTTLEATTRDRDVFRLSSDRKANDILHSSVARLEIYVPLLRRLRTIAEKVAVGSESEGFQRLFRMFMSELDDDYLARVQEHLRRLKFKNGILISAELTDGNMGSNYRLRRHGNDQPTWLRHFAWKSGRIYTYRLGPRDEAGAAAFNELRTYGISSVALAAREAADHILDFFTMLGDELAFYIGSTNLANRLTEKGEPFCFPIPVEAGDLALSFTGLYDVCSSLTTNNMMIGNDANAAHRPLIIVTGANQGGKSTFLRSVGTAQLMMQCGLFVAAQSFTASTRAGVFTHFKREEDPTLTSGKLDEELARMSTIADQLRPTSLVLFNESFAATNEREGSEIARQVIHALREYSVRVIFVTHQYNLASGFLLQDPESTLFMRAARYDDGSRPFKLVEAPPLRTGYGPDLYERIVEDASDRATCGR